MRPSPSVRPGRDTFAGVLFLLFGSSGAGKSLALTALSNRVPGLAIHDFDEIGVPPDANTVWRHRANEVWIRRAIDHQANGTDLLLAGQTPLGELLAVPSAPRLEAIAACLLDCDDDTRLARLRARGPTWLARVPGDLQDYLNWADWMRRHANDPTWKTDVIRDPATDDEMRWARWSEWQPGDPRWRVHVINTSVLPAERVADELAEWIAEERALLRTMHHPLSHWTD
jgi:hypothetical protein